jgi:hypothetical protein
MKWRDISYHTGEKIFPKPVTFGSRRPCRQALTQSARTQRHVALQPFEKILVIVCGGATATIEQLLEWSAQFAALNHHRIQANQNIATTTKTNT